MLIDVHCHLDLFTEEEQIRIIRQCKKSSVGIIVTNGTNPETNSLALGLSSKFRQVKTALGLYPSDALTLTNSEINSEIEFIMKNRKRIVAVGEIGIDLKESAELAAQKENFIKMINLAKELNKPVIVHSRKAEKECVEILEELRAKQVIMHCFSGKKSLVQRMINSGWLFSIPAIVKTSEQFQMIVKLAPLSQLLCETDSPFLSPVRGERNFPFNVVESYKKIAEIKGASLKEVEEKIEENYGKLF